MVDESTFAVNVPDDLLQQILEQPQDDGPRIALADW